MVILILKLLLVAIVSYIIGSFPTGYIVVKLFKNQDIRQIGSGSTGATNVKRVLGTKWFFIVLLTDALKGAVCVLFAHHFFDFVHYTGFSETIAALFAILGHSKSIFLKFTGGKSVATGVGTILALCWQVGLIMAAIWGIITYLSRYVSLGSIIALSLGPILMLYFNMPYPYVIFTAICAIYVIILHKENIKRLLAGTENKVR